MAVCDSFFALIITRDLSVDAWGIKFPKREVYRDILENVSFQYNVVGFCNSSSVTYVI